MSTASSKKNAAGKLKNAAQRNGQSLASDSLTTGVTTRAFYATLTPFEHYDSVRSQLFPFTNTVQEIAGSKNVRIATRSSVSNYANPYNLVTRHKNELFVMGGYPGDPGGAYVAKLSADTLEEAWRVSLTIPDPHYWNWPGVLAIHGNGQLYVNAGYLMARIDPDTGSYTVIELPRHQGQGSTVYNGFDICDDGIIFTKSMEHGEPTLSLPNKQIQQLAEQETKLRSAVMNDVPAFIVAINPHDLNILAKVEAPEAGIGRLTCERRDGIDYIYFLGITRLWRYIFQGNALLPDPAWIPFTYINGHSQPGTAVGLCGGWAIFMTNFIDSIQPIEVFAVNIWNSQRFFKIVPFPKSKISKCWSKPAIDVFNSRVYLADQAYGKAAALDFSPETGFSIAWEKEQGAMSSFWAITGPADNRQVIGNDYYADKNVKHTGKQNKADHVIWRDAATGDEIVSTAALDARHNPCIVVPGFEGRFYYMSVSNEKVVELIPEAAQRGDN
jgi:hypothetical protein